MINAKPVTDEKDSSKGVGVKISDKSLEKARKMMTKDFIKESKRKIKNARYYSEDNALQAIANMEASGLGRTGHRNLCKKLFMTWSDYKIALDIVKNPDSED